MKARNLFLMGVVILLALMLMAAFPPPDDGPSPAPLQVQQSNPSAPNAADSNDDEEGEIPKWKFETPSPTETPVEDGPTAYPYP